MWLHDAAKNYLQENGFEGLYLPDYDCSCTLDDLMHCVNFSNKCIPGHKIPGCTCGEGCDFHIGPRDQEKLRRQHCGHEGVVSIFKRKMPDDEFTPMVGDEYGEECPECGRCPR